MLVKSIAAYSPSLPIYILNRLRLRAIARYWSEIATFSYPLHLMPQFGVFPLEFRETFGPQKTRIIWGYHTAGSEDSLTVEPFRHNISVWRTDKRMDRTYPAYTAIMCALSLTHVKNSHHPTHRTALRTQAMVFFRSSLLVGTCIDLRAINRLPVTFWVHVKYFLFDWSINN